eukprot:SAG31_NODE_60_length_29419_cov_39.876398_8_plen_52_part_00
MCVCVCVCVCVQTRYSELGIVLLCTRAGPLELEINNLGHAVRLGNRSKFQE